MLGDRLLEYCGFLASRENLRPFPEPELLGRFARAMAQVQPGVRVPILWQVGALNERQQCCLNFPLGHADSESRENLIAGNAELNDQVLSTFDSLGNVDLWLMIEPGLLNAGEVADLLSWCTGHYLGHSCVRGCGIDVAAYHPLRADLPMSDRVVEPVDDGLAMQWLQAIQSQIPNGTLLLKHWDSADLPATLRQDLVFVRSSQMHGSLEAMKSEFQEWARHFSPALVFCQTGSSTDAALWQSFSKPLEGLVQYLIRGLPEDQPVGIVWSDTTLLDLMASKGISRRT